MVKTIDVQQVASETGRPVTKITITDHGIGLNPVIASVLIALGSGYLLALIFFICRGKRDRNFEDADSEYELSESEAESSQLFSNEVSSYDGETSATGSYLTCYSKATSHGKNTMSNSSLDQYGMDMKHAFSAGRFANASKPLSSKRLL
mmetsp:Transcript_20139/g.24842  ORF Transcript_20139/g.24842 Transcript_20139/m.24842 type:complete len:149 (+) Transcript_20139:529-975(+)